MNKALTALSLSLAALAPLSQANELEALGHIHGLAFGGPQEQTLLIGAHHGLFTYDKEGLRQRAAAPFDVMGLARDDANDRLYASGHPPEGGNLGLLRSSDGGRTFTEVSPGLDGPVDFHHLTISPADPEVIYGVHDGLQVSRDGGQSWQRQGQLPQKLLKLAASGQSADRLYAATEGGLLLSDDGGRNWRRLFPYPATSVHVDGDAIYAFVVGQGLIRADEETLEWQEVANRFGAQVLLDMAVSGNSQRLVGLNQFGALVESRDEGRNWSSLPPKPAPATAQTQRGWTLFEANCQSCHGIEAVGETYNIEGLTTQGYLFAPALNGSMHGWHHTDEQLTQTILEGSPRTDKMPAWKETLDGEDTAAIIAYLKTLWGETQRRCQGPGHMDRACLQGE